jgi:hypothetical protein
MAKIIGRYKKNQELGDKLGYEIGYKIGRENN